MQKLVMKMNHYWKVPDHTKVVVEEEDILILDEAIQIVEIQIEEEDLVNIIAHKLSTITMATMKKNKIDWFV